MQNLQKKLTRTLAVGLILIMGFVLAGCEGVAAGKLNIDLSFDKEGVSPAHTSWWLTPPSLKRNCQLPAPRSTRMKSVSNSTGWSMTWRVTPQKG